MEANSTTATPNLRIVNAYGRAAGAVGVSKPPSDLPRPIGPADADRVELSSLGANSKARRLVAASVDQPVTFQSPAPASTDAALAFYRHPADANAAATGVAIGRTLDVQG